MYSAIEEVELYISNVESLSHTWLPQVGGKLVKVGNTVTQNVEGLLLHRYVVKSREKFFTELKKVDYSVDIIYNNFFTYVEKCNLMN